MEVSAPVGVLAPEIILVSSSPRRAGLLRQLGLHFIARPYGDDTDATGASAAAGEGPLQATDARARALAWAERPARGLY